MSAPESPAETRRLLAFASLIEGDVRTQGADSLAVALLEGRRLREQGDTAAHDAAENRQALRELVRRP